MTWLPNTFTLARIVLLLPIMWLLTSTEDPLGLQLAFALFLVAALTDLADGWLARRLHCVTNIGAFLDPLADKIVSNVLLVFLACRAPDWVPLWMVLLLLSREFAVQGFRSLAPCVGVLIGTDRLSKLKTFFQLVTAGAVMVGLGWESLAWAASGVALIALVLALLSAYISMIRLFVRNPDLWSRHPLTMERR